MYGTHHQASHLQYDTNITSHGFLKIKWRSRVSLLLAQHPLANQWKGLEQQSYLPMPSHSTYLFFQFLKLSFTNLPQGTRSDS